MYRPLMTLLLLLAACGLHADDSFAPEAPASPASSDGILEELVQYAPKPTLDRLDLRNVRPKLRELLQANPILNDPLLAKYKTADNVLIGLEAIIAGKPVRLSVLVGPGCDTVVTTFEDYVLSVTDIKLSPEPALGGDFLRIKAGVQLLDLRTESTGSNRLVIETALKRNHPFDHVRAVGIDDSEWLTIDGNRYILWMLL